MGSTAILRRWIFREVVRSRRFHSSGGTFMSLDSSSVANRVDRSPSPSMSVPWLVLPLLTEGGDTVYKLRSLAAGGPSDVSLGGGGAELVGSSHGWVALYDKSNDDLYLSDPLSGRRINLPAVRTLPDPNFNLDLDGQGSVSKVILSSSPEEDDDGECRAMMTFGPAKRLAFCSPGRSSDWTTIGDLYVEYEIFPMVTFARVHEDLVYCTKRRVFTSVTPCHVNLKSVFLSDRRHLSQSYSQVTGISDNLFSERYDWDIQVLESPKMVAQKSLEGFKCINGKDWPLRNNLQLQGGGTGVWLKENMEFIERGCIHIPHLVYAEHSDQLFLVFRFLTLIEGEGEGGSCSALNRIPYCPVKGLEEVFECRSYGFIVMEMDSEGGCKMVEDLNGMAMFVGINHSFAIPARELPELKIRPNSIYFSDAKRSRMMCGVKDFGIFDYQTKTIETIETIETWSGYIL